MWLIFSFFLSLYQHPPLPVSLTLTCSPYVSPLVFFTRGATAKSQHVMSDQEKMISHTRLISKPEHLSLFMRSSATHSAHGKQVHFRMCSHTRSLDAFVDPRNSSLSLHCICTLRTWSLGLDLISPDLGIFSHTWGQTETADYQRSLGMDWGNRRTGRLKEAISRVLWVSCAV